MKIKIIFSLFILLCLWFVWMDKKQNTPIQANISESDDISFNLSLINGTSFSVKKENSLLNFYDENKAILFVFFTTWCMPCIAQIPHLNALQEKYKNDFDIVGVLLEDKTNDQIQNFIQEYKIAYKVANGENNYLLAKTLGGVNGIPTMFLYNKYSKLINQYLGLIPEEMLEIDIQKVVL